MTKLPPAWIRHARLSVNGANAFSSDDSQVWRSSPAAGAQPAFPPNVVVAVKALACQLPRELGLPMSRLSMSEFKREVERRGLVAHIGQSTLWRWLTEDAIRPWSYRTWIFPRDADFEEKAGRILDLYAGLWQGQALGLHDCIVSADEKTSIQARQRLHPTQPPASGSPMKLEHEYTRGGALTYVAAWDVRRAKIHGRCESRNGIAPFDRLVAQVMAQEPYRCAPRVFWVMDNGSAHRGERCDQRLRAQWPNVVVVHTPVHASWLNQVEVYFSVVQRKVLTPNDFASLSEVEDRLLKFQEHYEQVAKPFEWKFTRADLHTLLFKLRQTEPLRKAA